MPTLLACLLTAALTLPEMPAEYRVSADAACRRAAAATPAAHPDADTVLVANATHVEYQPDGTCVMWEESWTKLLTEKGRRARQSLAHGVSERYGRAEIQCVERIAPDGSRHPVDFAKTLKVATDNSGEGSNIYDPLDKVIRCGVPDLQVGDILRTVICDRTTKPLIRDAFATGSCFENTYPVLEDVFTVVQPDARPIRSAKLRNPVGQTVVRAPDKPLGNGRTLLKWTARRVPQAFPEPAMPAFGSVAQRVTVSTLRDWREVSAWYWKLCAPHLAKTNADLVARARTLAEAGKTREDRIRALFTFVAQEVRYVGLTLEDESPGYAPHDVDITFANRAGVCRDKAALLVAMLRVAGFEAYPVLIMVGPKIDPDVPTTFFNHAIVAVREADGSYRLMDPTAETTKDPFPSWLANRSYLVAHPDGDTLRVSPVPPASANALRARTTGRVERDGSAVTTTAFTFGGVNDNIYRSALLGRTPDKRRAFFEALFRAASPGAELLTLDITPKDLRDTAQPLAATATVRLPGLLLRGETRDTATIPFPGSQIGAAGYLLEGVTSLEKRRFPLVRSITAETEETVRLDFAEATGAVKSLPAAFREGAGGFSVSRTFETNGTTLVATRRTVSGAVEYSPEDYVRIRAARQAAETADREKPVFFARDPAADADVRILSRVTEIGLAAPRARTVTNTVEKEVLTYNGKRASAELKFAWNPACEDFRLVSATVSNRAGAVRAAGPKEMSFLDGAWAASAPRYPAGRRLVVNLPGVEIGSVIRFKTIRTVRDDATDFSDVILFDSDAPTDLFRYVVSGSVPFACAARGRARTVTNRFARTVRNARPLRPEPNRAPSVCWRDRVVLTAADYAAYAAELNGALARARDAGSERAAARAAAVTEGCDTPEARIKAIRDDLVKTVRVTGPALLDLPFDKAFFPPDRSLADGYASRTDWMNLLFAELEAAGFDPAFVLSDADAGALPAVRADRESLPRPDAFDTLLIRVTLTEGGFLGFGETLRTLYLAHDNEYTPVDTTSYAGTRLLTLEDGAFEDLPPTGTDRDDRDVGKTEITLRESGEADFDVSVATFGSGVGGLRRRYAEMLPEMRLRHYRAILNGLAETATATGELETDVTGYPFTLSFRAHAEGYATVRDDVMTVTVSPFDGATFGVGGPERHTPILIAARDPEERLRTFVFPAGYTEVEHLPEAFEWPEGVSRTVSTERRDGRLVVTLRDRVMRSADRLYGAVSFPYFRELNRRANAPESCTIAVRKPAR